MLTVRILCVGKMKEKFYAAACAEYQKRLTGKTKVEIVEVPDEKAPETLSPAQEDQVRVAEGRRLLAKIAPEDYVIALAIDGKSFSSDAFAQRLSDIMSGGKSRIDFVIGGSIGLSPEVLRRADLKLSFSSFTFCHQLMRVILLEQVYRALKILAGEPYHK